MVEPRFLSRVGQAEVILGKFSNAGRETVSKEHEVFPPIVVVIKEEGGEAQNAVVDTRGSSPIGEMPLPRGVRSIVVQENFRVFAAHGEVKVRPAIIVIVPASDPFDESSDIDSTRFGAFCKSPIAIVVIELTPVGVVRIGRFVSDK